MVIFIKTLCKFPSMYTIMDTHHSRQTLQTASYLLQQREEFDYGKALKYNENLLLEFGKRKSHRTICYISTDNPFCVLTVFPLTTERRRVELPFIRAVASSSATHCVLLSLPPVAQHHCLRFLQHSQRSALYMLRSGDTCKTGTSNKISVKPSGEDIWKSTSECGV